MGVLGDVLRGLVRGWRDFPRMSAFELEDLVEEHQQAASQLTDGQERIAWESFVAFVKAGCGSVSTRRAGAAASATQVRGVGVLPRSFGLCMPPSHHR